MHLHEGELQTLDLPRRMLKRKDDRVVIHFVRLLAELLGTSPPNSAPCQAPSLTLCYSWKDLFSLSSGYLH